MKLLLILTDLFLLSAVLIESMERYGEFSFNLPFFMALGALAVLNIYYLAGGKDKWSEKLLKRKFFKKQRLMKVILVPLLVFSLLAFLILPGGRSFFKVTLPSSASYIWYSKVNPDHYTESWTGAFNSGRGCSIQDGLKTKTICKRWREVEKKNRGDDEGACECYKNCPLRGKSWEGWDNPCDFLNNTCNQQ